MNRLAAMQRHLEALYVVDARGRLLRAASTRSGCDAEAAHPAAREVPAAGGAPRFHLARTPLGNLWRFRADLPAASVRRLATLAGKEAALPAESALFVEGSAGRSAEGSPDAERALVAPAPPEREEFMRRALDETAPAELSWAGAVFAFPAALTPAADSLELRARGEAVREPLHAEVAEPGNAAAALTSWALAMRARGAEPFFSAAWSDGASLALARQLGLVWLGEDRCWS